MNQISSNQTVFLGADPEFFFLKNGKAIGCERIIPEEGIVTTAGKIIIDGVQAEMNPIPHTCRESLAFFIAHLFKKVAEIAEQHEGVTVSVDPLVEIDKSELGSLSDKAKFFGCTPSYNIYDEINIMPIRDSSKYYMRSAGGHIHLGFYRNEDTDKVDYMTVEDSHERVVDIVKMLDIIVGNTCVLIDRHEGNIERRKVYGRAGEYRLPPHGIEYRTPSNFWLKDYVLMSFIFGLARMATRIITSSTKENDLADRIFKAVDQDKIREAINNNDFDLAMENFLKIKTILDEIIPNGGLDYQDHPLGAINTPLFLHFVNNQDILSTKDFLSHWVAKSERQMDGWESFLHNTVSRHYKVS